MVFWVRSIPETWARRNSQTPAQIGAMGELTVLGCTRPTATSWIRGTKVYSSLRSISRVCPGLRRTSERCLSREAPANPAPRTITRALRRTFTLRAIPASVLPARPYFLRYTRHLAGVYRSGSPSRRDALQNARPNVDCTDRLRMGCRRCKGCQENGERPLRGLERDRLGDEGGNGPGGHRPRTHREAHQPSSGEAGPLRSVRAFDLGPHLVLGVCGSGRRRVQRAPRLYAGQRPAPWPS